MTDTLPSIWIFQANPSLYDLAIELPRIGVGHDEEWQINQHRRRIRFGDVVLFWSASAGGQRERGIHGVGRICSDIYLSTDDDGSSRHYAMVRIENVLDAPIIYDTLAALPPLENLSILSNWQGTNFPVSPAEWIALVEHFPQIAIDLTHPPKRVISPPKREEMTPPAKTNESRNSTPGPRQKPAQNLIFFGPPGTGKTWSTKKRAVQLCLRLDVDATSKEYDRDFRRLRREGRIEFLTFHQSFAYEEFVEGIRPVMEGDGDDEGIRYQIAAGSFKEIALRAAAEGVQVSKQEITFEQLWQKLLERVRAAEEANGWYEISNYRGEPLGVITTSQNNLRGGRLSFDKGEPELTSTSLGAGKTYTRAFWENRGALGNDYSAYSYQQLSNIIAKELGTGGGCHGHLHWAIHFELLKLAKEVSTNTSPKELTAEQRLDLLQDYLQRGTRSGVTLNFEDADDYVLIIDEINRGNISKILGELITLLEASKRLTEADELIVRLPYSKERFAVPPNLHIIGTMNTADRSIALMDVALRRRFHFEEMRPNWRVIAHSLNEVVSDEVYGGKEDFINLVCALFENINARIDLLYDPDHQLGHSYFLEITGMDSLRQVFLNDVIPLLQEYFYGSWERICMTLGCPYDAYGAVARVDNHGLDGHGYRAPIITAASLLEHDILGIDPDQLQSQQRFAINPRLIGGGLEPAELKNFFLGLLSGASLERYQSRHYTAELQR